MSDIIHNTRDRISGKGYRLILPEGGDARILQAARTLADEGLAVPVLVADKDALSAAARDSGIALDGMEVIDPGTVAPDVHANTIVANRPGMKPALAARLVQKPLYRAGAMVAAGDADAMIAGVAHSTARVIEAGLMTIGLSPDMPVPSSFFLMLWPDRALVFADCAVNVQPCAEELAGIAIASASSAHALLGGEPKVAMLSFSTHGSGVHEDSKKVAEAVKLVRARAPELQVDGELQADAALAETVAAVKLKQPSDVAGHANVLIFPDLDAGNIAYKLVQYLAGARAIGPVLQGFTRPLSDLSRGASVEDIVETSCLLLGMLEAGPGE